MTWDDIKVKVETWEPTPGPDALPPSSPSARSQALELVAALQVSVAPPRCGVVPTYGGWWFEWDQPGYGGIDWFILEVRPDGAVEFCWEKGDGSGLWDTVALLEFLFPTTP